MSQAHQATAVAIGTRALMIEGASGAGKSSLALALIDRGAVLIGDDSLMLEVSGGKLAARPHPNTRGLLEVRGLGLLNFPVCESATVALVLRLDANAPRYIEAAGNAEFLGISLPMLKLYPHDHVLHLKAELALERFGLADFSPSDRSTLP
jgi:serine kinase of HPr protein (carbohydrate metabolism regulator)